MPPRIGSPPFSPVEPITDVLHGVPTTDPHRWLEIRNRRRHENGFRPNTNIHERTDGIPGRVRIEQRVP